MVYGLVNVNLYRAIVTKVSNALNKLVSGEKPGFQIMSKGLILGNTDKIILFSKRDVTLRHFIGLHSHRVYRWEFWHT